jgi:hypothetical protein
LPEPWVPVDIIPPTLMAEIDPRLKDKEIHENSKTIHGRKLCHKDVIEMKQKPELRILRKMCSFHDIELKFLRKIQI